MADCGGGALDANYGKTNCTTGQSSTPSREKVACDSITEELERRLAVGQRIKSLEEAFYLYNEYGCWKGFSVRRGKQDYFHDNSGELYMKEFECCAKGEKTAVNKRSRCRKMETRTGCTARLRIGRKRGEDWTVSIFETEHNHEMAPPDQRYLLKSARNIFREHGETLKNLLIKCGLSESQAFSVTEESREEDVGFNEKNADNHISDSENEHPQVEDGDANEVVRHFKDKSNEDVLFYWDFEVDQNNRMCNFFFRDGRCRIDYEVFGDVLSVDTTYKTNKYNIICASFVGVNHHRQNVVFGLAFMCNETESSFKWLFNTFLQSMGGKQPETIITDHCKAMMKGIETVFPDSQHRLFRWHINQNAPSHLGCLNENIEFKNLFDKCTQLCDSGEEFEDAWKEMIAKYGLHGHPWLSDMYKLRHKWSPAFSKDGFTAGLNATLRSEGSNSIFTDAGRSTHTLFECVQMFDKVQQRWREKEKEDDFRCCQGKLTLRVENHLLKEAAKVYTPAIYELFQDELIDSLVIELDGVPSQIGTLIQYKLCPENGSNQVQKVEFDGETQKVKCTCQYFESVGVLCKHALLVLKLNNILKIPNWYIKTRWTKNARNRVHCDEENLVRNDRESEREYISYVMRSCYDIATQSMPYVDARNLVKNWILGIVSSLDDLLNNLSLNGVSACNDEVRLDGCNLGGLGATGDNSNLEDGHILNPILVDDGSQSHWDPKGKSDKGDAQSSKRATTGVKRKMQISETPVDAQPSQEAANVHFRHGAIDAQSSQYIAGCSFLELPIASQPVGHQQPQCLYQNQSPTTNAAMRMGLLGCLRNEGLPPK